MSCISYHVGKKIGHFLKNVIYICSNKHVFKKIENGKIFVYK